MVLTKLAKEMEDRSFRAEDIASLAGLSYNTVVKAMKGKDISAGTAELIAHVMGKTRGDLA